MVEKSRVIFYLLIIGFIIYAIALMFYFNVINVSAIFPGQEKVSYNNDPIVNNPTSTPATVSDNLWLHVDGDRIVFGNGTPVLLRGVSMYEPYSQMFEAKWDQTQIQADCKELAQDWHANVIRIPVFPDVWYRDQKNNTLAIDALISAANRNGLYVIIDWHAAGNPVTGVPMTNYNQWDPRMDNATQFLDFVSDRYQDNQMVMYGIFNEPGMGITWEQWRPLAESLVGTVRNHSPNALVTVPGIRYAYDLSVVDADPVNDSNIVYETHIYPQSVPAHKMSWDASHAGVNGKYPVIVGEWGFLPTSYPGYFAYGTADSYGKPLVQYMDDHDYGWIAWAWSPVLGQPSMLKSHSPGNYSRTEYGDFVYDAMRRS